MAHPAKDIVTTFLNALNARDFAKARTCLSDDMHFTGVLGKRNSGDAYMDDMRNMQFSYEVQKMISDEHDVAVFYDIDMGGVTAFCAGWYHVSYGKIRTIKVLFDPRPVIDAQGRK